MINCSNKALTFLAERNYQTYHLFCFIDISGTLFSYVFSEVRSPFLIIYFNFWVCLVCIFLRHQFHARSFPILCFWYVVFGAGFSRYFCFSYYFLDSFLPRFPFLTACLFFSESPWYIYFLWHSNLPFALLTIAAILVYIQWHSRPWDYRELL